MKKIVLDLDEGFEYEVIGICTSMVDYRLAWEINQSLHLKLARSDEDYLKTNKKGEILSSHSLYEAVDDDQNTDYILVKNKSKGKLLVGELEMIDFFLLVNDFRADIQEMSVKLRSVEMIQTTVVVDVDEHKSFDQLVF
ncbi:MAG: IPExxxVDY family protein [Crocinitomicaceae bacterium]|nr:IPExxxVDY family protein [Crocinitomicaceae bacterium]